MANVRSSSCNSAAIQTLVSVFVLKTDTHGPNNGLDSLLFCSYAKDNNDGGYLLKNYQASLLVFFLTEMEDVLLY